MGIFDLATATIKRYGSDVLIETDGTAQSTKAFVQPLRYKNKVYVGGQYHLLGMYKKEKSLFIGSPDARLSENRSVITANAERFVVKRCETYYIQSTPIYVWAILEPYGDKLEDDYDTA